MTDYYEEMVQIPRARFYDLIRKEQTLRRIQEHAKDLEERRENIIAWLQESIALGGDQNED